MRAAMVWVLLLACSAAFGADVTFTKRPEAAKDGDKVKVAFAVSQATDVEVFAADATCEVK